MTTKEGGRVIKFWRSLGPGLITGAADDDPSGITTYSLAGAQFGTSLLWMAVASWPLMWAVQLTCARIGMVTGRGLMAAMRERFPRPVLYVVCGALFFANSINIGADLAGMADAAELLSGVNSHIWVVVFGVGILWAAVALRYATVARVLKWLALVLGAYVLTALLSSGRLGNDRRDPRYHDFAVPLFLAIVAGSRRRKGDGTGTSTTDWRNRG